MPSGTVSYVAVTDTVHAALNYGVATIDTAEGFCIGESAICKPLMGKYDPVAGDASDRLAKPFI